MIQISTVGTLSLRINAESLHVNYTFRVQVHSGYVKIKLICRLKYRDQVLISISTIQEFPALNRKDWGGNSFIGQLQNMYHLVFEGIKSKRLGRSFIYISWIKLSTLFFSKLKYWVFLRLNDKPGRKEKLNKKKPRMYERTTSTKSTWQNNEQWKNLYVWLIDW